MILVSAQSSRVCIAKLVIHRYIMSGWDNPKAPCTWWTDNLFRNQVSDKT